MDNKKNSQEEITLSTAIFTQKRGETTKETEDVFFKNMVAQLEKFVQESTPFIEQLKVDNPTLFKNLTTTQVNIEAIQKKIADCKTTEDFKKIYNNPLNSNDLAVINQLGEKWFNENQFEKAHHYFFFLSAVDPANADVWIAKGMAEQNLSHYEEALGSYSMAINLSPTYLLPYLQIIDCLILSKKIDDAKQLFHFLEKEIDPKQYSENPFYVSKVNTIKEHLEAA